MGKSKKKKSSPQISIDSSELVTSEVEVVVKPEAETEPQTEPSAEIKESLEVSVDSIGNPEPETAGSADASPKPKKKSKKKKSKTTPQTSIDVAEFATVEAEAAKESSPADNSDIVQLQAITPQLSIDDALIDDSEASPTPKRKSKKKKSKTSPQTSVESSEPPAAEADVDVKPETEVVEPSPIESEPETADTIAATTPKSKRKSKSKKSKTTPQTSIDISESVASEANVAVEFQGSEQSDQVTEILAEESTIEELADPEKAIETEPEKDSSDETIETVQTPTAVKSSIEMIEPSAAEVDVDVKPEAETEPQTEPSAEIKE